MAPRTPAGHALADDAGHGRGGRDDHRQIDCLGDLRNIRVSLDAKHALAILADRINRAAKGTAQQAHSTRRPTLP